MEINSGATDHLYRLRVLSTDVDLGYPNGKVGCRFRERLDARAGHADPFATLPSRVVRALVPLRIIRPPSRPHTPTRDVPRARIP